LHYPHRRVKYSRRHKYRIIEREGRETIGTAVDIYPPIGGRIGRQLPINRQPFSESSVTGAIYPPHESLPVISLENCPKIAGNSTRTARKIISTRQ